MNDNFIGRMLGGFLVGALALFMVAAGISQWSVEQPRYINVLACTTFEGKLTTDHGTLVVDTDNFTPIAGQPYTLEVKGGGLLSWLPSTREYDKRITRSIGYVGGKQLNPTELADNLKHC
jgi:hypothetical protein